MAAQIAAGLLIPFAGSLLGSLVAFFLRKELSPRAQQSLNGFASGVMIAAAVWSLLLPALEMHSGKALPWLPACAGLLAGVFFLLALDKIIPHFHAAASRAEGPSARLKKGTMLFLAVTIHNIPEGMAVGASLAAAMEAGAPLSLFSALVLSCGIALQNFPEGAVVAAPLKGLGFSRLKAFLFGAASGAVEPAAALLTILLAPAFLPAIPALLAFAAGAMLYVAIEDLIPDSQGGAHSDAGTVSAALGFALMMALDTALG